MLTIFVFALISQIPYGLLWGGLNVLFTFTCSLILLFLWDVSVKNSLPEKIIYLFIFILVFIFFACLGFYFSLDYRWYGILLPVIFYVLRNNYVAKYFGFFVITIVFVIEIVLLNSAFSNL